MQEYLTIVEMEAYNKIKQLMEPLGDYSRDKLVKRLNKDLGYFSGNFQIGDILGQAENMGIDLTNEQAKEIAEDIERMHDASIGINWEVIDTFIDMYCNDNGIEVNETD